MDEVTYLQTILLPIVRIPDSVEIIRSQDERGVLLTVSTDRSDMGNVIGKKGETAIALRRLLRQYGAMRHMRLSMVLNEPQEGNNPGAEDLV